MKKILSGMLMCMVCMLLLAEDVYADAVVSPLVAYGPKLFEIGVILVTILIAIVITWKIIRKMKERE